MITYHTIHMPSKINKLKYLRTTQLKRKINQMGFVWLYMQKMEFDRKTKINWLNEKRSSIPWGLRAPIWKINFCDRVLRQKFFS